MRTRTDNRLIRSVFAAIDGARLLPESSGYTALDILNAFAVGIYPWQQEQLDCELRLDTHVHGCDRPYAFVGSFYGATVALIPRDVRGASWTIEVASLYSCVNRERVALDELGPTLSAVMRDLCERLYGVTERRGGVLPELDVLSGRRRRRINRDVRHALCGQLTHRNRIAVGITQAAGVMCWTCRSRAPYDHRSDHGCIRGCGKFPH